MAKITIYLLLTIIGIQQKASAQSIENTVWKSFFGAPINDTAMLTIVSDSLTLTNSRGMLIVKSITHINHDTLTMKDIGGRNKCFATDAGIYTFFVLDGNLVLHIVNDPCDGRANAIGERKWTADRNMDPLKPPFGTGKK